MLIKNVCVSFQKKYFQCVTNNEQYMPVTKN